MELAINLKVDVYLVFCIDDDVVWAISYIVREKNVDLIIMGWS